METNRNCRDEEIVGCRRLVGGIEASLSVKTKSKLKIELYSSQNDLKMLRPAELVNEKSYDNNVTKWLKRSEVSKRIPHTASGASECLFYSGRTSLIYNKYRHIITFIRA